MVTLVVWTGSESYPPPNKTQKTLSLAGWNATDSDEHSSESSGFFEDDEDELGGTDEPGRGGGGNAGAMRE